MFYDLELPRGLWESPCTVLPREEEREGMRERVRPRGCMACLCSGLCGGGGGGGWSAWWSRPWEIEAAYGKVDPSRLTLCAVEIPEVWQRQVRRAHGYYVKGWSRTRQRDEVPLPGIDLYYDEEKDGFSQNHVTVDQRLYHGMYRDLKYYLTCPVQFKDG